MSDATVRGRFVWHELLTTDTAAAAAFYEKVIGWKPQAWPQDPSYNMFAVKAGPVAGLMALPEDAKKMGSPPCWVTYVGTPDVDETARQAAEIGGSILKEPTDILSVGRFAVIQDPQGAVFSAFTPLPGPMGEDTMTFGDFSWHELITTDRPAAFSFYERLFGWVKTEATEMGPGMGLYQMFGWPGKTLGGMFSNRHVPGPPHWLAYAMVPDSKRVADLVPKLGGRVLHGPREVPGGDWIATCSDPQGAVFAVHSVKPAVPEPAAKPAPLPKAAMKRSDSKPAGEQPVAKRPAAKKPVARQPVAKKAASKKPAAKKPAGKKPATKKAVARQPLAKKAAPKKSAAKKPAGKKPAAKKPVTGKPLAKKVAPKKPAAKKPAGKKPAAKKPVARKPLAKKAAPKKPAAKKPVGKKPAAKKSKPARNSVRSKAPAKARSKGKKG
jgi:predicted enzyme related to lactoylglutathione lyase